MLEKTLGDEFSNENRGIQPTIVDQQSRKKIQSILMAMEYDRKAQQFMDLQEKFYQDNKHESGSRKMLYETLGDIAGKVVLDAGCGYGRDADYYQAKGAIVHGIDASKEMIRLAHEKYPNLTSLSHQFIERTNYPDNFFDVIVSRYAIQHSANIETVYREWYRILKSQGTVSFVATHPDLQSQLPMDELGIVQVPLFNGECIVPERLHAVENYFPPKVLEMFELVAFHEKEGQQNILTGQKVPDFIFMKLRKK